MNENFVIGIDFGTDSVRSVLVDASNGSEIASCVAQYSRWSDGLYCNASQNQFRQHPLDYIEGLEKTIKGCIEAAGPSVAKFIRAIGVDTTGSTPVAVDESGTPLSLMKEFENNPNAMFVLWKDHTSVKEATEINDHAKGFKINYLSYVGGVYSSEWFWAKLLHILRESPEIRHACYSWVEHCDWIPFLLTGGKHVSEIKRSRCAAGHKAIWSEDFGGLPPNSFWKSLDPLLDGFTDRLYRHTYTSDTPAGNLCAEWSERLGLPREVIVCVGAFDAHMGAVGGQIEPYYLSKVMGTSTCDILVAPHEDVKNKLVKGISGQVDGSVIPGMIGMEAGQSAFGDVYAWFGKLLSWPVEHLITKSRSLNAETAEEIRNEVKGNIIRVLSDEASNIPLHEENELSIDWLNGRRTPFANQRLKAAISGLTLGSDAPSIFRSLAEATCFGARKIVDCFIDQGFPIKGLIGLGGVARKSPFVMQMMADVMNRPIRIHKSDQTVAAGAAMFAATAAGLYPSIEASINAMGQGFDAEFMPDRQKVEIYNHRYTKYIELGEFVESSLADKV